MNIHHQGAAQRALQRASALIALLLACPLLALAAHAQATPAASNSAPGQDAAGSYQTLYLAQKLQFGDANDVVTDLRNMIPKAKIYYVASANAVSVRGTPEEIAFAQKVVADLDRPRKMYRLTYTITDSEAGKPPSTQHISIIALTGVKTVFKQGRRVPLVTGDVKPNGSSPAHRCNTLTSASTSKPRSQARSRACNCSPALSKPVLPTRCRASARKIQSSIRPSSIMHPRSFQASRSPLLRSTSSGQPIAKKSRWSRNSCLRHIAL